MTRLLSCRSRLNASLLLLLGGLFILGGVVIQNFALPLPLWTKTIALVLQLAGILSMVAIAVLLQHIPQPRELLKAAKARLAEEEVIRKAWKGVQYRRLTFRTMSKGSKAGFLVMIGFGLAFLVYAFVADVLGLVPPFVLHRMNGETVIVPRWVSALFEVLVGIVALSISQMFRGTYVDESDEWKEALEQFFRDFHIT